MRTTDDPRRRAGQSRCRGRSDGCDASSVSLQREMHSDSYWPPVVIEVRPILDAYSRMNESIESRFRETRGSRDCRMQSPRPTSVAKHPPTQIRPSPGGHAAPAAITAASGAPIATTTGSAILRRLCVRDLPGQVAPPRSADRCLLRPKDLHTVNAHVALPCFRIPADIQVPRPYVPARIAFAPLRNREAKQINLASRDNIFEHGASAD